MDTTEVALFSTGIVLTLVVVILVIKAILKGKQPKDNWESEANSFIEHHQMHVAEAVEDDTVDGNNDGDRYQKILIKNPFRVPVSLEKIQNQKPWKSRAVPTVSVTQHVDPHSHHHPLPLSRNSSSESVSRHQSVLEERRKSITTQMMIDIRKHGKHVMYSSPFHNNESGNEDNEYHHLAPSDFLSDDGGSLTTSSIEHNSADEGKERYMDSRVYGVKKRVSQGRRLGHKTHNSPMKPSFKKTGKLVFEVEYVRPKRKLVLNIVKCSEMRIKEDIHHTNTFVRAYVVPGKLQRQQTKVKRGTHQPVFNETLTFTELDENFMQRHKLRLKVYNHSKLKKHNLIGEVDIALVTLRCDVKDLIEADLFVKKSENSNASVLVSIYHEAALSKLQVNIEEAKNLPKANLTGLNPDPYAIIKLYKGNSYEKKETLHLRNTRSPKFHETFQFPLATDFEFPLNVFSLVVTIVNKVLIGRDEIIGHVIFSLDSPQSSAVTHWGNVQTDPHKMHTRWHSLIDPDDI